MLQMRSIKSIKDFFRVHLSCAKSPDDPDSRAEISHANIAFAVAITPKKMPKRFKWHLLDNIIYIGILDLSKFQISLNI